MKFLIIALFISLGAFAQENTIDDLDSLPLNISKVSTPLMLVAYLGLGSEDYQLDCLILDVQIRKVTLKQKMQIAKNILVKDGFYLGQGDPRTELRPVVKDGRKIVFNLVSGGSYLTHIQVSGRDGKTLQEAIASVPGINDVHQVSLVYVRGCRF